MTHSWLFRRRNVSANVLPRFCIRAMQSLLASTLLLSAIVHQSALAQTQLPVFPGAVGFGTDTAAGRGGTVRRVTTLADSGTGSLREALSASGPRVVIFDVSGIIHLQTKLSIRNPNVTVAGQTAPPPGIIIKGAPIFVNASNVLIQHLAVRPGNEPGVLSLNDRDSFQVDSWNTPGISNIVFDHVSGSWSTDEVLSTWSSTDTPVRNVTVFNSIFAEALRFAGRQDCACCRPPPGLPRDPNCDCNVCDTEGHSAGVFFGKGTSRVSMIRSVSAFNRWRNPRAQDLDGVMTDIQLVNNFIYWPREDQERTHLHAGIDKPNHTLTSTVRGNVYIFYPNQASSLQSWVIDATASGGTTSSPNTLNLFVADNLLFNHGIDSSGNANPFWAPPPGGNPWTLVRPRGSGTVNRLFTQPAQFVDPPLLRSDRVEMTLLTDAGARSAFRDPVDRRIVREMRDRVARKYGRFQTGYVDSADQVGGYPQWPEKSRPEPLQLPAAPSSDTDNDGYTDLEELLHDMAFRLEGDARVAKFDSFEDGNANGWHSDAATSAWQVVNDGSKVLRQPTPSGDAPAFLAGTYFYDHVVEATVRPIEFDGADRFARVFARYRTPSSAYYVTLRNSGKVQLRKIVDPSTVITFDTKELPIRPGHSYRVRLAVNANELSATVTNLATHESATLNCNGTCKDISPLPPGYAAVGTFFASADFDDVFVSADTSALAQLRDDFDDGSAADWTHSGGTWSVTPAAPRAYRQADATAGLLARSSWNTPIANRDQSVQATVKPISFSSNGFVSVHARYIDPNNNYYVTLRDSKLFELKKVVSGTVMREIKVQLHNTFDLTQEHTLRIEVTGTLPTKLKGYLDGEHLLTLEDETAPYLDANRAAVGTRSAAADFDDIIVTTP